MKKDALRTKEIQRLALTKEVLVSQITGESIWERISICCSCIDLLRQVILRDLTLIAHCMKHVRPGTENQGME